MNSGRAAFFEVDGVLLAGESRLDFLRHWLAHRGDDGALFRHVARELALLAKAGAHRTHLDRVYSRHFVDAAPTELQAAGHRWYETYCRGPAPFVEATLAAMERHRADGDALILVSAAPAACVRPVARDVRAHDALCADITQPMSGDAKAAAVIGAIAGRGLDASRCFAYAHHPADLPLLSVVGNPRVVDRDPGLVAHARANGWPVLPAFPCAGRRRCA